MTLDELIEDLQDAREDLGGEAEVRIAYQPSWPLRATLRYVTVAPGEDPYDDGDKAAGQDKDAGFAWLAVCDSLPWDENPYAPRWAWQQGEADR